MEGLAMESQFGIIDIGSNTIRMNIYEVQNAQAAMISTISRPAGLAGYIENKKLTDKGIDVLSSTLTEYQAMLAERHIEACFPFATASLRNITNTQQVLDEIEKRNGLRIDLISGKEEAQLSYKGAKEAFVESQGLYIDTGGGSTEMVLYDPAGVRFAVSLPVGSLNLYEDYIDQLFPTKEEIHAIHHHIKALIKEQDLERDDWKADTLCVTGGSFRAIRALLAELGWIETTQTVFPVQLLRDLLDYINKDAHHFLRLLIRIVPTRINTLIPGLLIVETIAKWCRADQVQCSFLGIREGYLKEKLPYNRQERSESAHE